MYLLLRADQRLKQDHEDVLLPAHLYLSVKDLGLNIQPETYSPVAYPVSKRLSTLSSSWSSTSRRRWSDWILEIKRLSSERIWEFSILVWWNVEEWNGRRRRQQEKISILYWFIRTRNSSSPSSPRSFRTQSHWSFITGQCVNSGQFLRVHWSRLMCNHFAFHHKFRIDTREHKIGAKGRRYSWRLWIFMNKEHKDPNNIDMEAPRLAWYKQKQWKIHQDTVYWVDIKLAQQKGFKFYQTRSNAIILYDTVPAYCIPKAIVMETGEIIHEKVYASPRPPPKIFLKDNWMKELDSEVAGSSGDSQQIQPRNNNPIIKNGETCEWATMLVRLPKKLEKDVLFGCERTNVRTGRPVDSCVLVSVERVDKDKDADENVDADQTSTGRPVSGQPTGLFIQREEIDIDFRVSGFPHAVVKQAENFRVRELVKKIKSHPHREALQADLQQKNVHNTFSDESKAMIREMGNVELFESCETFPKVQCAQCLLYWNQGVIYCTCGHLLVESESSQKM